MVKNRQKRVNSYDSNIRRMLLSIAENITAGKLEWYDIVPLQWHISWFRIRKWKFRIIFSRIDNKNTIIEIDTRWDSYKNL